MQLGLNSSQFNTLITWLRDPTVIGIIWYFLKRASKSITTRINFFITDNNNRVRDELSAELKKYIDTKFKEHEVNAFGRLDELQSTISKETKENK